MTTSALAVADTAEGQAALLPAYQKVTPALLAQIRDEFLEMPGLHVTLRQACRLWSLDAVTCDIALRILVDEQFLGRTRVGAFRRARADAHA